MRTGLAAAAAADDDPDEAVLCCCEFVDRNGQSQHMLDCNWISNSEVSVEEIWTRYARVPFPGGSRPIGVNTVFVAAVTYLAASIGRLALPICDIIVVVYSAYRAKARLPRTSFFWYWTVGSLAVATISFATDFAPGFDDLTIIGALFLQTGLLIALVECKRGPVQFKNFERINRMLIGQRMPPLGGGGGSDALVALFLLTLVLYFVVAKPDIISKRMVAAFASMLVAATYVLSSDGAPVEVLVDVLLSSTSSESCPLRHRDSGRCRRCDTHVLRLDHHCVWLDTCIGAGNHMTFLLLLSLGLSLSSAYCYAYILSSANDDARADRRFSLFVHIIFLFIGQLLLLTAQCVQIWHGTTTSERIRSSRYSFRRAKPSIRELVTYDLTCALGGACVK